MVSATFAIPQSSSGVTHHPGKAQQGAVGLALRQYVYGPENLLLHEALATVTTDWGRFNPLVITGASGFGKTLLLAGLATAAKDFQPVLNVQQFTGADYVRAVTHAIDVDSIGDLRSRHRGVDLFVVDGLQELADKTAAQWEFLHTLDALADRNAQVIISTRGGWEQPCALLPGLISRLSAGLVIPLHSPRPETLSEIGQRLITDLSLGQGEQILARILNRVDSRNSPCRNVPELQAALKQAALLSEPTLLSHDDASVSRLNEDPKLTSVETTTKAIVLRVAKYFHVTLRDLTGSSRRKTVVQARCMVTYLLRKRLQLSFSKIGRQLGGRDHTTIMNSYERAGSLLKQDPAFQHATADLLAGLR